MIRNSSDSNCLSDRQGSAFFTAGPGGSSRGYLAQESPWIGLLSSMTRPAISVLQKFFPEHSRNLNGTEGFGGVLENSEMRTQQNLVPDWISTGGLRDLGIECMSGVNLGHQGQSGLLSSQRTVVSFVSARDTGSELLAEVEKTSWFWGAGAQRGPNPDLSLAKKHLPLTPLWPEHPDIGLSGGASLLSKTELDHIAASGQERLLSPDQEHGYSSLEDVPIQGSVADQPPPEEPPRSSCRNKDIAFIMGLPTSDDEEDDDDDDDEDDDDDDGFDSQGSSEFSSDEDGDDSDGTSERLWTSFLSTGDPYNPRNFTALQLTAHLPLTSAPPGSPPTTSTPLPSTPTLPAASPPLDSSSPPCGQDMWDDSASEDEESASAQLLSLFGSSDPYNPFNFQAPVRTPRPAEGGTRSGSGTCASAAREQERSKSTRTVKKVRFCEEVQEFYAGSVEEDRRGPWEEFARDRHRFLRRCQEVELNISYCLQPQHRSLVYCGIVSGGDHLRVTSWPREPPRPSTDPLDSVLPMTPTQDVLLEAKDV